MLCMLNDWKYNNIREAVVSYFVLLLLNKYGGQKKI